jgi:transcriptional regulator with XRE-family HTH domain
MDLKSIGAQLQAARKAKRISTMTAARLSGVSRRHIVEVENGANVTLLTLEPLMRAYEMTQLSLGDLLLGGNVTGLSPQVLDLIANELEEGIQHLTSAVESLRSYSDTGKPSEIADAAALVREATRAVKKTGKRTQKKQRE